MSASVNQFKGHIDKYLRNRAEDYTSQRLTPFLVNYSTGDFNCPKINWTSLTCPENDNTSTNLNTRPD